MKIHLICPDFNYVVSGGNLYNKKLINASQGQILPVFYERDTILSKIEKIPEDEIVLIDSLILTKIGHLVTRPFMILCHLPSFIEGDTDKKDIELEKDLYKEHPIIVTGNRMKNELMRSFDIYSIKIFTILPGIDHHVRKQHYKNATEQLVWIGNLIPRKGFLEMLDYLKQMTHFNWYLDVYGSTDFNINYTLLVKDKIAHCNLENRITFKQALPHDVLMKELAKYDLLLQFSRFESFGMAVFEALNIGLPVLGLHLNQEPYFNRFIHSYSAQNAKEWLNKLLFLVEHPQEIKKTDHLEARTWDDVYQDFSAVIKQ